MRARGIRGDRDNLEDINIDYKILILIFGFARFLDALSTYIFADRLLTEGISIAEIASIENNFIVSTFWVHFGSIPIGLLLDFIVVVGVAAIIIKFATPYLPDPFVFFFTLAGVWHFTVFGFFHNLLELYYNFDLSYYALEGWIGFFGIALTGVIIATLEKAKDIKYIRIRL